MKSSLNSQAPTTGDTMAVAARSSHTIATLRPGLPLLPQLLKVLDGLGTHTGFVEFFSGNLTPASYSLAVPTTGAEPHTTLTLPLLAQDVALIHGSATIGTHDEEPYLHCHALWRSRQGRLQAGHLHPPTLVGCDGLSAAVFGLHGAEWRNSVDHELHLPILTPYPKEPPLFSSSYLNESNNEVVLARLQSGQDIMQAATSLCSEAGWTSAVIRAGLGSVAGGQVMGVDGTVKTIQSKVTQVVALMGHLSFEDGSWSSRISATLVDADGGVHAGELVAGENPVAVTLELTLMRGE